MVFFAVGRLCYPSFDPDFTMSKCFKIYWEHFLLKLWFFVGFYFTTKF
jgi:hypothetical protein